MVSTEVLDTIEEWNEMPLLHIFFDNVPEELQFVINRNVAKLGYFPSNLSAEDITKQTTENATSSAISGISDAPVGPSTILRVFFSEGCLTLSCNGKDYSIASRDINTENIERMVQNVLEPSTNTLNERTHTLRTLLFSPPTNTLITSTGFGVPLLILNGNIEFMNAYMTFDGNLYEKDAIIELSKIPFGTFGNYVITNYEVINMVTKKIVYNASPIICIWDKYVLYADGNLSDTTLTWKFKAASAPIDYIIDSDRLYLVDVTNGFYVINLKTRRVLYSEQLEGITSFSIQQGQIIIQTTSGNYKVNIDSAQRISLEKQEIKAEVLINHTSIIDSVVLYPSITKVERNAFGFFRSGTFLGERIVHLFVRGSKMYVITEVGTWIMGLSD
ncbi:MAG TPA: hypothetical protein PKI47_01200 [Fervidobacterium sp.]|nr:hypothetical protein [Fervidobacterium sp.]HOH53883.1 hypothetical protein [Fervidobacterium sp.]